jgi:hypothetical protein
MLKTQEQFMAEEKQFQNEQRQTNTKHEQSIQRLEVQVGQLAKEMNVRKQGEFPAQTYLIQEVTSKCKLSQFSEVARK